MQRYLDKKVLLTLAVRTFRHSVESPIAYIVALFFYGFVGSLFGLNYFVNNQASSTPISIISCWVLWFVIPALTMGLISDELRSGTFEQLATLPIRDWEIVLGKFLGFAFLVACVVGGLVIFPIFVSFTTERGVGTQVGSNLGLLFGIFFLCLSFGSMGLFASSLAKNQVVALIIGMIFCTFFFFTGQFYSFFPGFLSRVADFVGVTSHVDSLSRGVWDVRDLLYFVSVIFIFLYLTVQRLSTRRF